MTLKEYFGRATKTGVGEVKLTPEEVTVYPWLNVSSMYRLRVVNVKEFSISYVQKGGELNTYDDCLYVMDQDGNPRNRSVFSLSKSTT